MLEEQLRIIVNALWVGGCTSVLGTYNTCYDYWPVTHLPLLPFCKFLKQMLKATLSWKHQSCASGDQQHFLPAKSTSLSIPGWDITLLPLKEHGHKYPALVFHYLCLSISSYRKMLSWRYVILSCLCLSRFHKNKLFELHIFCINRISNWVAFIIEKALL